MTLTAIDWIIMLVYFVFVLGIGFALKRYMKTSTDFLWMKDESVAAKVAENLHRPDGDAYRLDAYCVMSNHVHTVFTPSLSEAKLQESFDEGGHLTFPSEHPGLSRIMHSLKGRAARECNLVLSRTGQFWEHESFDHVVRQGKLRSDMCLTIRSRQDW